VDKIAKDPQERTFATRRRKSAAPLQDRASRIVFSLLGTTLQLPEGACVQGAREPPEISGRCGILDSAETERGQSTRS